MSKKLFKKKQEDKNEYTKNDIKKWRDEQVYPILKKYDLMPEVSITKGKTNMNWVTVMIILFVAIVGTMIYGFESGAFKSDINQNVSVTPNNTINNEYSFNPETNNQFKFEMPNITVNCPEQICQCDCGD